MAIDDGSSPCSRPEWHVHLFAVLALGAAVLGALVEGPNAVTVLLLCVALVPWALLSAGVHIPLSVFVLAVMIPTGLSVLGPGGGAIFLGMVVVLYVFSATRDLRVLALTMVAGLALPALGWIDVGSAHDSGFWYFSAGVVFAAFAGSLVRRQYELNAELREAQHRIGELAAADERRRIAREVHDIVAHSLTVVLLNVAGARKAMAIDPQASAAALERAEVVGRQALDDVRRTVGLLRGDEPSSAVAPLPSVADLDLLVDGYRAAGLEVVLAADDGVADIDPVTGATVYRFVQEGLSNILVHAPGAPAEVVVRLGARTVEASVRNGAARTSALAGEPGRHGLGLVGMRERVEARGGSFQAGPDQGGWLVTCSLPLARRRAGARP